jgi:hypothetical protein
MGEHLTITAQGDFKKYKRLKELIKRTSKENPKPEDLAALRNLLDECPELWRAAGSMAERVLYRITQTYFQLSAYGQEITLRRNEELREQLGYADASPLERLLIEQVLICHLNVCVLELNTAGKLCESHTTEAGLYWDRRLTGAHRRLMRALETLAKVRKLTRSTPINVMPSRSVAVPQATGARVA